MKTFFISDPHYDHGNILKFKNKDGTWVRPFLSLESMQRYMIERHNSVVRPEDKVYYLGDVVMNKKNLSFLDKLNGRKSLVAGNHDIHYTKLYLKYFENVRGCKMYPKHGIIMSHIPVHPNQLEHRWKYNVHGHLHNDLVTRGKGPFKKPDPRYINISAEQVDYTPISWNQLINTVKARKNSVGIGYFIL